MADLLQNLAMRGVLTASNHEMLSRFANRWNLTGFDAILETKILSETKLADEIAEIYGFVRLQALPFEALPESLFNAIDYKTARALEVMPLGDILGHQKFFVLLANPTDKNKVGMVRHLIGQDIELGIAERHLVRKMIDRFYPITMQLSHILGGCSDRE